MEKEKFESLVARAEALAASSPSRYRSLVIALASLGYLYVGLVIFGLCFAVWKMVWWMFSGHSNFAIAKFAWVLLVLVWIAIKSMFVRVPAPEGVRLTQKDAPALFRRVEELRRKLRGPRIDVIQVDDDLNASLAQVPRFLVFGHRSYLTLGLPLMLAMSKPEFDSVIAHEIGHLSGNHGFFTVWIYRVRRSWEQLITNLHQEEHFGAGIFTRFFKWYAPRLEAFSLVLMRAHEYEADRSAAEMTSPQIAGNALRRGRIQGRLLESEFWPSLWRKASHSPLAPNGLFVEMQKTFQSRVSPAVASAWLQQAAAQRTNADDTHPSLTDRLKAFGFSHAAAAQVEEPPQQTAAEAYFGSGLTSISAMLEQRWLAATSEHWSQLYQEAERRRSRLQELLQKGDGATAEEQWERAYLCAEEGDAEQAIALLSPFLDDPAYSASANFLTGRCLLHAENPAGEAFLLRAKEIEPDASVTVLELLADFHERQQRFAAAEMWRAKSAEEQKESVLAAEEREGLDAGDTLIPHQLSPEQVERLREQLQGYERIKAAYIARKQVRHRPHRPMYVVGLELTRARWYTDIHAEDDGELLQQLQTLVEYPGETFIVFIRRERAYLGKKMKAVAGSVVFDRRKPVTSAKAAGAGR